MKTRIADTLTLDTLGQLSANIKGLVTLSPNEATFMDSWWSPFPKFSEVEKEFFSIDKVF